MPSTPCSSSERVALQWTLLMRWIAVSGQMLALVLAAVLFDVRVPWAGITPLLLLNACSNAWLHWHSQRNTGDHSRWQRALLWLDIAMLSALLHQTGGPHNPFSSFFLLHIALAAMTQSPRQVAAVVMLCVMSYAVLFFWHRPILVGELMIEQGCPSYSWHLQGMAVAFVLTAIVIAAFVSQMQRVLHQREEELATAMVAATQHEQFVALATLSAGVAHELGSPLGTIALASSELRHALKSENASPEAIDDAQLICDEVERCRRILDRLNQQATSGIGEVTEHVGATELWQETLALQPAAEQSRYRWLDRSNGCRFELPRTAVIQALAILLQNARDADPRGQAIEVSCHLDATHLHLRVRDHGTGLSESAQIHAGQPFFTTKEPGKGMGLGLFLVRTLALRLHGSLTLQTIKPHGTEVCLSLKHNVARSH